jgi:hypothetical protein
MAGASSRFSDFRHDRNRKLPREDFHAGVSGVGETSGGDPMSSGLRIGYVGSLETGGTCYSRLLALQSVENGVLPLDTRCELDFSALPRVRRWIEHLPGLGPATRRLNRRVARFAVEQKLDLLWIDKGTWVDRGFLHSLRQLGIFLVQHVTDALWPAKTVLRVTRARLAASAPQFDCFVTSNAADAEQLRGRMGERVLTTQLGYDERRFTVPVGSALAAGGETRRHKMVFVGHHEPRTERGIVALIEAGLPVSVFGSEWVRRARWNRRLSGHAFPGLTDTEYVAVLQTADIGLGFVSEWNYNETAGRSYEIPACGTFLLALRTPQHLQHYREGEEAEFFGDEAELVQKAQRYSRDHARRQEIAAAGLRRCRVSGYSWREIMLRDWARILELRRAREAVVAGEAR